MRPIPWFALGDAIESKQIEKIPKEFLEKEILELKFPEQKEPSCLKIAVIQGVLHKLPKEEISLKGLLREDTIYFLKNEEAEILKFFSGKEILENENKIKEVLKMKTPKLSSTQRKGLVSLLKRGQEYQIIKAEKAINL